MHSSETSEPSSAPLARKASKKKFKKSKSNLPELKTFTSTLEISSDAKLNEFSRQTLFKQESCESAKTSKSPSPELKTQDFKPIKISEDTDDESKLQARRNPKLEDPFLRDLTACIQMKQQKKMHDLKPADELLKQNEPTKISPPPTISKTFAKPSFNLEPKPSTLKTSTQFNLTIKTPVSAKKCFLNITLDKPDEKSEVNRPEELAKEEKFISIKPFNPVSFKTVKKEIEPVKVDDTEDKGFKTFTPISLKPVRKEPEQVKPEEELKPMFKLKKETDNIVKTKLNHLTPFNSSQVNSLSQVSTSTSPMVSKAAPVTSFTLASLTPLKPTKIFTNSCTNTENVILQTVSTNTEIFAGFKSIDGISDSTTEFVLKKDSSGIKKKNEYTQTKSNESHKIKLKNTKRYFNVEKFLNLILENEFNLNDMNFMGLCMSHLVVWLNSPRKQLDKCFVLVQYFGLNLNRINYLMLNDAKFYKKVSFFFNFFFAFFFINVGSGFLRIH